MTNLKNRLHNDEGFTLVELLVVIIILGILLAIAIPSYLSFRDRANNSAAKADVRAAIPAVEAWNADHQSGYTGVNSTLVRASYDAGVKGVQIYGGTTTMYCISSKVSTSSVWYKAGPGADISTTKVTPPC